MCNAAMIAAQVLIGAGTGTLNCYVGSCGSLTSINADVYCTDFSVSTDCSSGERYDTRILPIGQSYTVSYYTSSWLLLAIGGAGDIQVTGKINLAIRPDGQLNTSPTSVTLPVIYKQISIQHVHVVQMADADATDTLKCRWSTSSGNTNGYNECGSVCSPSLPTGYTLYTNNCTLVFILTTANYYAVALQIEDYYTSSSSTPMSSVPIQFLFYGRSSPGGCSTPPSIIGNRPNLGLSFLRLYFHLFSYLIVILACVGVLVSMYRSKGEDE